ncbi:MAG: hypothetical protein IJX47_00470 [Clostridia bacterium]|nr:hypothetical protein [Clostridia bacterium]
MAKKKKSLKPIVLDTAFFVGGVVFGELIAYLVRNIGFLKWLSFEVSGTLDLVLVSISIHLNPAVVLFPLLAVVGGRLLKKTLSEQKRTFADLDEDDGQQNEYIDNEQYQDL